MEPLQPHKDDVAGGSGSGNSSASDASDQGSSAAPSLNVPGLDDLSKQSAEAAAAAHDESAAKSDAAADNEPAADKVAEASEKPADETAASPVPASVSVPEAPQADSAPAGPAPAPPVMGSFGQVVSSGSTDKPRSKKMWLLVAGAGLGVVLLAGGGVFGLYLPNTPDNVWKTGLNRSGDALNSLVQTATTDDKLKLYSQTSNLKGTVDVEAAGMTFKGSLDTAFDKTSLQSGLNATLKAEANNLTINADALSKLPEGSVIPDIYFRLSGFKDLGLDQLVPGVSDYDGQWIAIKGDYLKSIAGSYFTDPSLNSGVSKQPTAKEIAEAVRITSDVAQDYVFTTDADKAVLVQKSFVGKEQADGMTLYHYKAGVNQTHAAAFCTALETKLMDTAAYKKLAGQTTAEMAEAKKNIPKDCKTQAGDTEISNQQFDLWIDKAYKLVHKIRIADTHVSNAYTEFGQTYKGGDKLSLFTNFHNGNDHTDGTLTIDTDLHANSTKAVLDMQGTGDSKWTVKATLNATSSAKPVEVTLPTNAIPVQEVLDKLGMGGLVGGTQPIGAN